MDSMVITSTGASASTLQDIKVRDSSGGYAYKESGSDGSAVRNRFIYWRAYNDVLELVEESFDINLIGSHVRYRFQDTPILGGVTIHEDQNSIAILVATVASVHRLVFPHPVRLQKMDMGFIPSPEQQVPSIFYDASLATASDPQNFHLLNPGGTITFQLHSAATYLNHEGEALFTFATNTGSILVIKLPPFGVRGVVQQQELSQSSVMQKLWNGIVPAAIRGGQEAEDTVHSMIIHPLRGENFILSVCKDHKLRMWSTKTHECVMICNLLDFTPGQTGAQMPGTGGTGHTIKVVTSADPLWLKFCVHLNFHQSNQFLLLEPALVEGRYQMRITNTIRGPPEDLVDFSCTSDYLWTLWTNSSGESVARVSNLSRGPLWKEVLLQTPESVDIFIPPNQDPRDFYTNRIFHPGRFTQQDIIKALNVYRRCLDSTFAGEATMSHENLKEAITSAVENEIRNSAIDYEIEEEDYYNLQASQWSRFYSCCVQYQEVNSKLKGLFTDCITGLVGLIKKGSVSFLRPCDVIEGLYLGPKEELDLLRDVSLQLDDEDLALRRDILKLFTCLSLISKEITEDMSSQIEFEMYHEDDPQIVAQKFIDYLFFCPRSDEPSPVGDIMCAYLQEIQDIKAAIETIMRLMDLTKSTEDEFMLENSAVDASRQMSFRRMFTSITGCKLLAESVTQYSSTRFVACRDFLLLQMAAFKFSDKCGVGTDILNFIKAICIPQTTKVIHCYMALKFIAQTVASPYQHNSIQFNIRQLSTLEISDTSAITSPRPAFQNATVLELFIQGIGGQRSREQLAHADINCLDLIDNGLLWSGGLLPIVTLLAESVWPNSDSFLFPEFLVGCCQYLHLQQYVSLLKSWCEWNISSRQFLLGIAYLHFDEPLKAAHCFIEAQEGISSEKFLFQKLLQTEETDIPKLEVLYYLKVIKQFEEFSFPEVVIYLANNAKNLANPDDPNLATLLSKIFKYHLELGHNADAYTAMIDNPDPSRRKDCLRQLLVILCERGELQTLVSFPYTDLEDEVVSILESRARSVDLATYNYYDLLYSFHIFRNNFRKAGSVMYEHGCRLGNELPSKRGLQRQAQCYLATINALRLIKSEYAWIVKPVPKHLKPSRDELANLSPKHSYDGEDKDSGIVKKLRILELKDIEKEYLLVDARLRLIKKDPDPALSAGPTPNPDEMVGLLVNAGLYDRGLMLCKAFDLKLHAIFESLALRCVNLAKNSSHHMRGDNEYTSQAWDWLKSNSLVLSHIAKENSSSDQAWHLLQSYLNKYEDSTGSYHRCTAIKLLTHGFALPTWFVKSYKGLNPSALLRLYIDYDLLEEASVMVLEYIDCLVDVLRGQDNFLYKLKGSLRKSPQQVWMPYNSIDQLLAALGDHRENILFGRLHEELENKLTVYFRKITDLSQDVTSIVY